MGMGVQLEQHRLGFEKTISWEMGLGPPPSRPSCNYICKWLDVQVFSDKDYEP